jgi:hypothetical protein
MGVTCDLRLIDHEHVVQRGLPAVNRALKASDPALLRDYILSLPYHPNPDVIAMREDRLARLRHFEAPAIIIENEERLLAVARGEACSPAALAKLSLEQLRETLGQWNWINCSYSLDKAWYELDWFLQPADGEGELLLYPSRPKAGDARQTLLDQALVGARPSPCDSSGAPLIRTCGSPDATFGYNDPPTAAAIAAALCAIDPQSWSELLPARIDLHRRAEPGMDEVEAADWAKGELEFAQGAFPVLRQAYQDAAARHSGVACEYSL